MELGISNRVAVVLGAGGGLGTAIAKVLAFEGAKVAVCDVSAETAERTVTQIAESGGTAEAFTFDLSDLSAADDTTSQIEARLGGVDILVNITGGPPATPVTGVEPDEWRRHFDSMVTPVIHITDRVLAGMRSRGWGRVITSTSSGVVCPIPNLGLSNSLRSALLGWSKTLAGEVGADGVTVNVVVPGRIATSRIHELNQAKADREGRSAQEVSAESSGSIPLRRYGKPEEYADCVVFLSSARAAYINGAVIRVDGGLIPSV